MGSTATSTAKAKTKKPNRCRVKSCKADRAIVVVGGVRKRAKECGEHISPRLKHLVETQGSKDLVQTRNYCGARLTKKSERAGKEIRCKRPAGAGTDHVGYGTCKLHGGRMRNPSIAAAREEMQANTMPVMGLPIDVDPMEALLQCVRTAAGQVNYCTWRVQQLSERQATVRYKEKGYTPGEFGGEFSRKTTDERMAIWITAQRNAMADLARYSKMALDAGIDERQVRIAEDLGGMIGRMIRNILQDLGLNAVQAEQAPEIVRRHLQMIEGQALEAGA